MEIYKNFETEKNKVSDNILNMLEHTKFENISDIGNLVGLVNSSLYNSNLISGELSKELLNISNKLTNFYNELKPFSIYTFCIGKPLGEVLDRFFHLKEIDDYIYELSYYLNGNHNKKMVCFNLCGVNNYGWEILKDYFPEYNYTTLVTDEILKYILIKLFKYEDFGNPLENIQTIKLYFDNNIYSVSGKFTKDLVKDFDEYVFNKMENTLVLEIAYKLDVTNRL